jgi:hypothetical protein
MSIYSLVNAEKLELYEPSMLDDEEEKVLSTIEDLAQYSQVDLVEETFFHRNYKTIRWG